MAGIGTNSECIASDENRLTLSDENDALGVPKATVSFSSGPNEQASAKLECDRARNLEAAGALDTVAVDRTAHTLGTCRMGTDPETSVVDADGRSHEVPNLWICDGSVFPSSLIANPALTIMALGLRTAERFLAA